MSSREALGVIALVPDDWDSVVTARHQVLRRLAQFHQLVWLEPARNWREYLMPSGSRLLAPDRWVRPAASLEVLAPGFRHPEFLRPEWLNAVSFRSRLSAARKRLLSHGAQRLALSIWRHEFSAALDLVPHDFSCYHIDDEYSFSDVEHSITPRELHLLQRVDQVVIHSPALFEKKGKINPSTAFIPNGVDFRLFATPQEAPADLAAIKRPRIGYAGVIKRQLDFDLLTRLACARPEWSFVLVGPVTNVTRKEQQFSKLLHMPNVHLLGAKPAEELPKYVQHFDVCLMCYEVNDYTRYIYPLKLHEYLAAGRPTVSSEIDAVRPFAGVVATASGIREWLDAIETGLRETDGTAAERRRAVARRNDWDALVSRLADLFVPRRGAQTAAAS